MYNYNYIYKQNKMIIKLIKNIVIPATPKKDTLFSESKLSLKIKKDIIKKIIKT